MNKYQTLLTAGISSLVTLVVVAGFLTIFGSAAAAPPAGEEAAVRAQSPAGDAVYSSISALAFMPVNQDVSFNKDLRRQILSLTSPSPSPPSVATFVAPLALPDQTRLTGVTVYGEDFDNQGAVRVRLKRCDHGQARCIDIAETTSTQSYAAGQFETNKVTLMNEVIDNSVYSYLLELELTALLDSGLRSVRLEMEKGQAPPPPPSNAQTWSLSGDVRNYIIPTTGWSQVRICTDDLSPLPNPTHYPSLIVDGNAMQLASNTCVTVWGNNIEIRRDLNTSPSSGTYQILR